MIQRCSRCALSLNFPNIKLNEEGVCNFCLSYLNKTEYIGIQKKSSIIEIDDLINSVKGKFYYDGICCYSGGKDSSYLLDLLKTKYDLNILAVTIDNGYLAPVAFENIRLMTAALDVDHQFIAIRPSFMKRMYKSSLFGDLNKDISGYQTRISGSCLSCISLINSVAYNLAARYQVPLIFAGFTAGQIPKAIIKNPQEHYRGSYERRRQSYTDNIGTVADRYFQIQNSEIEHYQVSPFFASEPKESDVISRIVELGWKKPEKLDGCSSNCRLNAVGNAVHLEKFGFHPYEAEMSQLVRSGSLSRGEAIEKLCQKGDVEEIKIIINSLKAE